MGQDRRNCNQQVEVVHVSRIRSDYLHRLGIQRESATKSISLSPYAKEDEQLGSKANTVEPQNQDDFRASFFRKLSYSRVWVPRAQRPPQHQTVVIFDWDDTLLCTSFLNLCHSQSLPLAVERHFRAIETAARMLLELALRLGQAFIITNAEDGWVEHSCSKWAPKLLPILQKVRIISARTRFEPQYPGEVSQWKVNAFLEVQRELDSHVITNLISLGDSNFEMDAVHVMGKGFRQALIKTIKFRQHPSPEELQKQLELVSQKFEQIVDTARNLKMGLERKQAASTEQRYWNPGGFRGQHGRLVRC